MKPAKLRIAWSVFWAVLAALLIVLWVRSHSLVERFIWNGETKCFGVSVYPGEVSIELDGSVLLPLGYSHETSANSGGDWDSGESARTIFGLGWQKNGGSTTAYIPLWFLVLTCAALA